MSLKAIFNYKDFTPQVLTGVGKFIDRAVEKSLAVMELNIKQNTPVKTGTLKRSITSKKTTFGKGEVFTNPNIRITRAGKKMHADLNYAIHVEYGTRYMAPRAMFRKGVEQSEERIKQIFAEEARDVKNMI